jgi:KTSC domain
MNSNAWQDAHSSMKFHFRYVDPKVVDGVEFGRLEVRWENGSEGAYLDVNRRTYDEFLASDSRGKFLNRVLKPGFKYERREIPDDAEGQDKAETPPKPASAS